jgi:hypothetical protein
MYIQDVCNDVYAGRHINNFLRCAVVVPDLLFFVGTDVMDIDPAALSHSGLHWVKLLMTCEAVAHEEPLQSTRARIANRMSCKMESKLKEPKAPRTTLSGTKSSHNQHTNTTHTT